MPRTAVRIEQRGAGGVAALRIFSGDGPPAIPTADDESRPAEWRAWEPVSVAAHGKG